MILVCLHGAPGVGKLTIGRQLAGATSYIFLHDHLIIETAAAVFPFGRRGFAELRSELFSSLLQAAASTGRGIIITHADDTFWQPRFDELLSRGTLAERYKTSHVLLTCDPHEHRRRISDPDRSRYQKITDMDRLQRLVRAGEFVPRPASAADLVVDTTTAAPNDVAVAIAFSLGLLQKAKAEAG